MSSELYLQKSLEMSVFGFVFLIYFFSSGATTGQYFMCWEILFLMFLCATIVRRRVSSQK